jgi:endonuclease/exonuclease/phosphatase family metal-dependent hydrolase
MDRRVRPKRIADVLKEVDADVVALQEVAGMDEPSREHNHLHAIAEELGLDYRIGENRRLRGASYGNAVLTRLPIHSQHNHDITFKKSEPRGALHVTLGLGTTWAVQIFNVHLGTGFFERRYQGPRLINVLNDHSQAASPRIVLGDFNEWTRGRASHLLAHHFQTAEPRSRLGRARSYPGIMPLLHLDHIYYDSPLKLTNIDVHRSRLALLASDHLPLVADFQLNED